MTDTKTPPHRRCFLLPREGYKMLSSIWADRHLKSLYKSFKDKEQKLKTFRDRRALGLNPLSGFSDNDILFNQEMVTEYSRLNFESRKAVLAGDMVSLQSCVTGLTGLRSRITSYGTVSPTMRATLEKLVEEIDQLAAYAQTKIDQNKTSD